MGLDGDASIALVPDLPGQQLVYLRDGQSVQPQAGFVDPREELVGVPASVLGGQGR